MKTHIYAAITLCSHLVPLKAATLLPGLFNTGVDSSEQLLATGTTDSHYNLVSGPDSQQWKSSEPHPFWLANSSSSAWLTPNGDGDSTHATGTYALQLTIDLTGIDPNAVTLAGRWLVDNDVELFLNGASTGETASNDFTNWSAFSVTNGFQAGLNILEFQVENTVVGGDPNPVGLRVEFTSATVPEPSVLLLAFAAALGFSTIRHRGDPLT